MSTCASFAVADFKSDLKPIWCPGCGDFGVLQSIYRALSAIGRAPHEISFVSGIGCSSRIPGYTTAYGFNSVHGRALPIAQGGILYVEPLYTERIPTTSNSSTFPQLSRVLVSLREPRIDGGVRVGYAPTLAEALDQVFGPGTGALATRPGGDAAMPPPPSTAPPAVPPGASPTAGPPPAMSTEDIEAVIEDLRGVLERLQDAVDAPTSGGG